MANLRLVQGLEVCETDEAVWLGGREWSEALELDVRKVPGAQRFRVIEDDLLVPWGARVPTARLPGAP